MKLKIISVCMILASLFTGCISPAKPQTVPETQSGQPAIQWPTIDWQTSTPEQQGVDPAMLKKMQAYIREQKIPLHSLLIIRNGMIISETYYGTYKKASKHELYSVTKSFTSTLVGIALDQGKLKGLEQRVAELLPGRMNANDDTRKQSMTLENLLMMSSGLDWVEGDATYQTMYMSPDWVQMVMDLPMATDPGKQFVYCSGCSHVLSAIVQQAVGENTQEYAVKNLFQPIGITNPSWEFDRNGIPIGGWGLDLTPREMAKLGYLFLHNGNWDGKQVVSEKWVKAATTRHIGTDGGLGYGYQWWTYPTHNAYAALGRYGQTIFVAPEQNMVIVTTAQIEEGHDPIFALIDNYIFPAVK
jgi:CubicO group peptidase (beta-lactamase class C family)